MLINAFGESRTREETSAGLPARAPLSKRSPPSSRPKSSPKGLSGSKSFERTLPHGLFSRTPDGRAVKPKVARPTLASLATTRQDSRSTRFYGAMSRKKSLNYCGRQLRIRQHDQPISP